MASCVFHTIYSTKQSRTLTNLPYLKAFIHQNNISNNDNVLLQHLKTIILWKFIIYLGYVVITNSITQTTGMTNPPDYLLTQIQQAAMALCLHESTVNKMLATLETPEAITGSSQATKSTREESSSQRSGPGVLYLAACTERPSAL